MGGGGSAGGSALPDAASAAVLVPCIMIRDGSMFVPGPEGPAPALDTEGDPIELFDIIDGLAKEHRRAYLVDLDGIEGHDPQLDYLQEVSRDLEFWVDAGVRNSEQAIDVIVAGASRVVISCSRLRGPEELARTWGLTTSVAVEIELEGNRLAPVDRRWGTEIPGELAGSIRRVGVADLVLGFRTREPDWELVRSIAAEGPTWVAGAFEPNMAPQLSSSGAAGGVYYVGEELLPWAQAAPK